MTELEKAQAMLVSLEAAYFSGVLNVRHGEESITYQSMSDLLKAISVLKTKIAALSGSQSRQPKYIYQSGKGL